MGNRGHSPNRDEAAKQDRGQQGAHAARIVVAQNLADHTFDSGDRPALSGATLTAGPTAVAGRSGLPRRAGLGQCSRGDTVGAECLELGNRRRGQTAAPRTRLSRAAAQRGRRFVASRAGDALCVFVDRGVVRGGLLLGKRRRGKDRDTRDRRDCDHGPAESLHHSVLRMGAGQADEYFRQRKVGSSVLPGEMIPTSAAQPNGATLQRFPLLSAEGLSHLGAAAAGYGLPFLLIVYLALKGGGYDSVIYSEVGIASWWIVLIGVALGVLPSRPIPRIAWVGIGLLLAFAAWTALGIGWSESAERSAAELGRVATYLGVFGLAVVAQGREGLRRTLFGVAAGIALVGTLAVLSRLHPSWFPNDQAAEFFPSENARLNYPLNYWNGLAALMAIGIPLLTLVATEARYVLTRALAAAALPVVALAAYFTFSRGGTLAAAVSLVALFALSPHRLRLIPVVLVAGAGSALLIASAAQREALDGGLATAAAQTQGDQMLAVVAGRLRRRRARGRGAGVGGSGGARPAARDLPPRSADDNRPCRTRSAHRRDRLRSAGDRLRRLAGVQVGGGSGAGVEPAPQR